MKIKQLIRLAENQPLPLEMFYKLAVHSHHTIPSIAKFMIRLERLRKKLK